MLQSHVEERESLIRTPTMWQPPNRPGRPTLLREKGMIFEAADMAGVRLAHRPEALGRGARLVPC